MEFAESWPIFGHHHDLDTWTVVSTFTCTYLAVPTTLSWQLINLVNVAIEIGVFSQFLHRVGIKIQITSLLLSRHIIHIIWTIDIIFSCVLCDRTEYIFAR